MERLSVHLGVGNFFNIVFNTLIWDLWPTGMLWVISVFSMESTISFKLWYWIFFPFLGFFFFHKELYDEAKKQGVLDKNGDFDLEGFGAVVWENDEGIRVGIDYVDAKGKSSRRDVIVHKIFKDGMTRFYLQGLCLMRHATRTFNSEKIAQIWDENGEILDLPKWINDTVGYKAYGSYEIKEVQEKG